MRLSMPKAARRLLAALLLVQGGAAAAQQPPTEADKRIVAGPGAEVVAAKCQICHDLSHITRSRLSRDEWEDNLKLMVNRGLVITPEETKVVLDYLAASYGPKGPPPNAPVFGASGAAGGPADVQQLLAANACTGCHAVDKRVVGPSFKEVAAKYGSRADRVTYLSGKLRQGSVGIWGQVPMPAMPQLSAADAEALVNHVLAQK